MAQQYNNPFVECTHIRMTHMNEANMNLPKIGSIPSYNDVDDDDVGLNFGVEFAVRGVS